MNFVLRFLVPLLKIMPILFLGIFYFYPLWAILKISLAPQGNFDFAAFEEVFKTPYYYKILTFSAWQAFLSTALTLIFAFPAAYLFSRYKFCGKTLLKIAATLPFIMPTIVVATAFKSLFGTSLDNTLTLILLAHIFYNYSLVLRIVGGFWANLDPSLEKAAATLGASPIKVFWEITLPLLLPALLSAALLIFILTFSAFGTILILSPQFSTIEVEIYKQASKFFNLRISAVLSLLQMVITLAMTWIYTRQQYKTSTIISLRSQKSIEVPLASSGSYLLFFIVFITILLLLVAPLVFMAVKSLSLDNWSFRSYIALWELPKSALFTVAPINAIGNSIFFATISVFISLTIGVSGAYLLVYSKSRFKNLLDPMFMLPLGTSAVTLGFGYIVALDMPPLNLRSSLWLVPFAHSLIALPFVVRTMLPILRRVDPKIREAASVLGASPAQVIWEIDFPIIARGLVISAIFAFTISLGEFGASLLISRPEYPTIPVVIYRFLGQPGLSNYGQALAMSTLLMLVSAGGYILIEKLRTKEMQEF